MADNDSFNQGLWGTGPTANTNWNDYQQGKSIREWNQQALADQNKVADPTWGLGGANSDFGGFTPAIPVYGGSSLPRVAGSPVGSAAATSWSTGSVQQRPGIVAALLALPVFIVTLPIWAALYPISALLSATTALVVGKLLSTIAPSLGRGETQLAAIGATALVLIVCTRTEQVLGRIAVYRYARYVMRFATFGLLVTTMMLPGPGVSGWFTSPQVAASLLRTPQSLSVIGLSSALLFWISLRPSPRAAWHRLLVALRLRAFAID